MNNENDVKILAYCYHTRRSINELARLLNISPASVSLRVKKLEDDKLITVERKGDGKKSYVRTTEGDKKGKYFVELLKQIKQKGGDVSDIEYNNLLPIDPAILEDKDKMRALMELPYTKFVEKRIRITRDGEDFLKKNKKK